MLEVPALTPKGVSSFNDLYRTQEHLPVGWAVMCRPVKTGFSL